MAGASGKKLDDTYKLAWLRGRGHLLPAHAERRARGKSTVQSGRSMLCHRVAMSMAKMSALKQLRRGASAAERDAATDIAFCGVDDPTCEACQ
jgi:ribonucleoside-diphosphate reductase alpha chain